ncbi:MAG: hypothetical protein E5V33_05065, partial [Mesorhizobium sp.]
ARAESGRGKKTTVVCTATARELVGFMAAAEPVASRSPKQRKRQATRDAGMIELEIDGIAVRVGRGAETKTVLQ